MPVTTRTRIVMFSTACAAGMATLAAITVLALPSPRVFVTTEFAGYVPNQVPSSDSNQPDGCVAIEGSGAAARLFSRTCGATDSTYRILDRVSSPEKCVGDADMTHLGDGAEGVLCLDYDWTPGQCLLIDTDRARNALCSEVGAAHAANIVVGGVDVSYCPGGGLPHPVRKFTVCVEITASR
jgi:hypothetical protein